MKRTINFFALLIVAIFTYSQTQQGCVKTRGRMINGKHVPGKGLTGAIVSIQGKADVGVKRTDGHFSFPATDKQFIVESVTKKEYILVDADAAPKMYHHTTDTLFFLMETPERLAQDTLDAMRRIRRTLQRQLQEREDEIEVLKAEKKITEQEYRTRLQKLYDSQCNNEKLISEMAKRYSMLDYDKLDEFYRQVNYCIEQGELTKADSLLRSRGNVESQIKEQQKKGATIQQKEKELQEAKEVYKHDYEELARRCYGFYENFKMQHQHDSALYYLELRVNIDTTNTEWLSDVGNYCFNQNIFDKAEHYYKKVERICQYLSKDDSLTYKPKLAATLAMLGVLYVKTLRFSDAEAMYKEALSIYRPLVKSKTLSYEYLVAIVLSQLANVYTLTGLFSESEKRLEESLTISRRLAKDGDIYSELALLNTLNHFAYFYIFINNFSKAEKMSKESLTITRRLAESNPSAYEPCVLIPLEHLAIVYRNTQRISEAEQMYKESLTISRRLAESNPSAYEPQFAYILSCLADFYSNTQQFSEAEQMYKESLSIYRRLAKNYPSAYELFIATTLRGFAYLYSNAQRFSEAEQMYKESLLIWRRLAESNPSLCSELAETLYNLADFYSDTQQFSEAEQMYKESLLIWRRLAESNPSVYEHKLAFTLYNLAYLYSNTQRFSEAEKMLKEVHPICRRLSESDKAMQDIYLNVLYNLSYIYGFIIKEYKKAYEINEEFIPYIKQDYINNPKQYKSDYAQTLGNQSFYCMFISEFEKAEEYASQGLKIDSSQTFVYSNLAASLLMQGKYTDAEKLYRQYKDVLKNEFLLDLEEFEKADIIPKKRRKDVEKIKVRLNE